MPQAVDISNYSDALTPEKVAEWRDRADVRAVFVQAVDPPRPYPASKTRQQCQAVLDAGGVALHAYVFWWYSVGTDFLKRQLDLLSPFTGKIAGLWPDVEDTTGGVALGRALFGGIPEEAQLRIDRQWRPVTRASGLTRIAPAARVDDLASWLEVTDQFETFSRKSGLYGASWHWPAYMGNSWRFSEAGYRLWAAEYNDKQTLTDWTWFGGWSGEAAVHQYAGTSTLLGIGNVDLNVVAESEILLSDTPTPAPEPAPEPSQDTAALVNALGYVTGDMQRRVRALALEAQDIADELERVGQQYGVR